MHTHTAHFQRKWFLEELSHLFKVIKLTNWGAVKIFWYWWCAREARARTGVLLSTPTAQGGSWALWPPCLTFFSKNSFAGALRLWPWLTVTASLHSGESSASSACPEAALSYWSLPYLPPALAPQPTQTKHRDQGMQSLWTPGLLVFSAAGV